MGEKDLPPTVDELSKAIDSLRPGKAPGKIIKCGNPTLLVHLHKFLCAGKKALYHKIRGMQTSPPCSRTRATAVTVTITEAYIIARYVSSGRHFAKVVMRRLQLFAEIVYPESKCGFRTKRSTIDMIFSLRQLQEKSRDQRQPLYIVFIDLAKEIDLVGRKYLFRLLEKIGCPPKLL